MYESLFSSKPLLEGEKVILRFPVESDAVALYHMLQNDKINEFYLENLKKYNELQEVMYDFVFGAHRCFELRRVLSFTILNKKNLEVIGYREIFVDEGIHLVTIQGFLSEKYRNQGFTKDAYNEIIKLLRKHSVEGIKCTSHLKNFTSISMLNSVGFELENIYTLYPFHKAKFILDLNKIAQKSIEIPNKFKSLHIFCRMCFGGYDFKWSRTHVNEYYYFSFKFNFIMIEQGFSLKMKGSIMFVTDGFEIFNENNPQIVTYIAREGLPIENPFQFILKFCSTTD